MEASELITPGAITAALGIAGAAGRWGLNLWATVRREGVAAAAAQAAQRATAEAAQAAARQAFEAAQAAKREAFEAAIAAAARADNDKMVAALVEQARSNAALVGELAKVSVALGGKLDTVADKIDELRERTPVEGIPIPDLQREPSESRPRRPAPRQVPRPASRGGFNNEET